MGKNNQLNVNKGGLVSWKFELEVNSNMALATIVLGEHSVFVVQFVTSGPS